jgi:hypothetical protein
LHGDCARCSTENKAWSRLSRYEDIGSPEELAELIVENKSLVNSLRSFIIYGKLEDSELAELVNSLQKASDIFNSITKESDPHDMYSLACDGLDIVEKVLASKGLEDKT